LPPLSTPLIAKQYSSTSFSTAVFQPVLVKKRRSRTIRNTMTSTTKTMVSTSSVGKFTTMKGVISVQPTISGVLTSVTVGLLGTVADRFSDLLGKSFLVELHQEKRRRQLKRMQDHIMMGANCPNTSVPYNFGDIGAVLVENQLRKEAYIKDIVIDDGGVIFSCESWIHSKYDNPDKRIFFTNKSYLPSETPMGIKALREKDLKSLRGINGEGERKTFERIYDYDTYNDIGDPDSDPDLSRPVLGGDQHPYPRRCRTGRKMTSAEPWSESRTALPFYVPRDEDFSEIKEVTFGATTLFSVLDGVIPMLESILTDRNLGFSSFMDIGSLYTEGVDPLPSGNGLLSAVPRLIQSFVNSKKSVLQFETPRIKDRDSFSWVRDEEFCRQTLAGLNPYSIQLVTEWPLMSKLDPEVYGPAESAITKEIVEQEIKGFMTLDEALEQKKLFVLDYHDLLLPYVNKVREIEGTTLYGSRTLMFLTSTGTLRPLAIELTCPPNNGKPQWKHVLRTHGATEPYIIATNRHLSKMHPIQQLLCPHLRYTMQINSLARLALINAGGTIDTSFSLRKYAMQLSSDAYAQQWRFDHEALPADLISRGMAVEDKSAPHGLKLTIEDYPFANDGLLLWDAITRWATTYVYHYYPQPNLVESDTELQAWWTEIRTVGHGDKKDEPWWPQLKTQQDLIKIVTTIMWVASGHHSAVNFGQYDF
ncbi:hypothetical protein M8C21_008551, partial [Ambrosia artemisiifolia]